MAETEPEADQYSFGFEGTDFQAIISKSHREEPLIKAGLVKINNYNIVTVVLL